MIYAQLENDPKILAAVLFGSQARKDADDYSDRDLFALCNCKDVQDLINMKKYYATVLEYVSLGLSFYKKADVEIMANAGSLFMWHLKLQGRVIFSKQRIYEDMLNRLQPYGNYRADLRHYKGLLNDVLSSYDRLSLLSEFDMSVLFTIARNVCILLCYNLGRPKFGRSNAYLHARSVYKNIFPLEEWIYPLLCSQKLLYERAIDTNRDMIDCYGHREIIDQIQSLLDFAEEQCS